MDKQVLNVEHLKKSFGNTEILHDICLNISRGDVYGLVGQNGALEMMNMIESIHRDGKSILISSHILQDMDEICTNIAILEKGNLVYSQELEGSFVIRTEPIPLNTYGALTLKYTLDGNENRTVLRVKTDKTGVSQLVKELAAGGAAIYEVSSSRKFI